MELVYYKKGADAARDQDFKGAGAYGKIRLGETHLYGRRILKWVQVPIEEITHVWQRIEQVQSATSCCEADFNIHRLNLQLKDGTRHELLIGDSLFRHEDAALLAAIGEKHPHIVIRKPELSGR